MAILNTNSTQDASLITGNSFDFLPQAIKTKFLTSFETDLDSIPLYIFYGRAQPWDSAESDSPTRPNNSFFTDISTRENILALKKVDKGDTRAAFVKFDWKYGKAFKQYDITKDQTVGEEREYYAFQSNQTDPGIKNYGAVYKCLDNNGGVGSTVRPDFDPQAEPKVLSDGYKWKYMFKIPAAELAKFQTNQSPNDDFIPLVEDISYAGDAGTIDRIDIKTGGSSYNPPANTVFPLVDITGNNTNDDTPVGLFVNGDGLEIDSSTIIIASEGGVTTAGDSIGGIVKFDENGLDAGGGYYRNAAYSNWVPVRFVEVGLTDGQIDNLIATDRKYAHGLAKINAAGSIDSPGDIKIIDGGTSYQNGTKVKIVQSSTLAYAKITDGAISKVKVINAGKNHRNAEIVPVHATGTDATFTAQISPYAGHGALPKQEMNASAIFINNRVTSGATSEDQTTGFENIDFSKTNDFRQVGLIQGPRIFNEATNALSGDSSPGSLLTSITANAKYKITVPEIGTAITDNITQDTLIKGNRSGAQGKVVDVNVDSTNDSLRVIRYTKIGASDFIENENLLATGLSAAHRITANGVSKPEVDVFSGDILFINNSEPITRDVDQSETVNFIITF
jgi:hypothetical protein